MALMILEFAAQQQMSHPLWMSGYYDNKNATYCQITDTAYAELQDKIAAETDEAKKKNW